MLNGKVLKYIQDIGDKQFIQEILDQSFAVNVLHYKG